MTVFKDVSTSTVIYTELTGSLFFLLLVSGALGAIAMIIPGISGSFLLLAIGTYATVIGSVSDFNIPLISYGNNSGCRSRCCRLSLPLFFLFRQAGA